MAGTLNKILSSTAACLKEVKSPKSATLVSRCLSTSEERSQQKSFKILVVGGGTGGAATANAFCKKGLGSVGVIEPNFHHFNQGSWSLVGGGLKRFEESRREMADVLPSSCVWIKDRVMEFNPEKCTVTTLSGELIEYEFLVCALGLQLDYNKIKGLPEAFEIDPTLASNFWRKTVPKTWTAVKKVKQGNAIFTFPNSTIKCAGAPQKIMYLAEEYFRQNGLRDKVNVMYNTSAGAIFGVKKYAETLARIAEERDIIVNYKHNLIEVRPDTREAVFEILDWQTNLPTGETKTFDYSFLHVAPPMSAPEVLRNSSLVDETGYVSVDKETLQHTKYSNIFAIGDNTNVPTSKTAAAVASQTKALNRNLTAAIKGKPLKGKYDGYTSCPLITARNRVIMAEFDSDGEPLETFPLNQAKERWTMFMLKCYILPQIYWNMLVRGYWHGPGFARKLMRLGFSK